MGVSEFGSGGEGEGKGEGEGSQVEMRAVGLSLVTSSSQTYHGMHLDPGVNRLGLNVTSVHQTDGGPVTPNVVLPISVIL